MNSMLHLSILEKLVFEWKVRLYVSFSHATRFAFHFLSFIIYGLPQSGLEKKPRYLKGEMLMYELVMVISTEALATAGNACDLVAAGEFKDASLQFKKAARLV
jgi:hypothetical protein